MNIRYLIAFLIASSSLCQAQTATRVLTLPPANNASTASVGAQNRVLQSGYSFSEGTVGGKSFQIESSRIGGTTLSTGSLGGSQVNTLTIRLNSLELTTGTVGNESIEIITIVPKQD